MMSTEEKPPLIRRIKPDSSAAYAGIGSRETPEEILGIMVRAAKRLGALGYTLRSGGADGADRAFYKGACYSGPRAYACEIFTPWRGFLRNAEEDAAARVVTESPFYERALLIAADHHPNWAACSAGARKLHARNVMQVLGPDLATPSKFVVCWTKTGGAYGGTGEAIRIAQTHNIKVLNLQRKQDREEFSVELAAAEITL